MKMSELKEKTAIELRADGRKLREELFNLRLQKATSQLEKPSRLRELRKDIARVETQLSRVRLQAQQKVKA
jgi:large subunit ribosomal protein L29